MTWCSKASDLEPQKHHQGLSVGTQAAQASAQDAQHAAWWAKMQALKVATFHVESLEQLQQKLQEQEPASVFLQLDGAKAWEILEWLLSNEIIKIRTLELHISFGSSPGAVERQIGFLEALAEQMRCTGSTLESFAEHWAETKGKTCSEQCEAPEIHSSGGIPMTSVISVSYVHRDAIWNALTSEVDSMITQGEEEVQRRGKELEARGKFGPQKLEVPQLPLVRLRVEHSGPWPWYEREHRAGYVTKRLTHL
eukprot:g30886.t1